MKKITCLVDGREATEGLQPVVTTLKKFGYEVFISKDGKDALKETSLLIIDECSGIGGRFVKFLKENPVVPCIIVGCGECKNKEFVWWQHRLILEKAMRLLDEEVIAKVFAQG